MPHEPEIELLRRLTEAAGPPGQEDEVRAIVRERLTGKGELRHDRLGSLICERSGPAGAPRVVLDAHMDEVAFLVHGIQDDGLIQFLPLGGWWGHVLLAQRLDILTEKGRVAGVISSTPPHFLSGAAKDKVLEIDAMFIDVGASSLAEVQALGVRVGDAVVPHARFMPMGVDGVLSAKAFDDRAGVGVLCESFAALASETLPCTLVGVAAVQEEVGCRGARTASAIARPDVAIVLEGTPADDLPGHKIKQAVLGKGPQVRVCDPTALSSRRLVRFVEKVAADEGIAIQIAARRSGGTNASSIHLHGEGVPTVVIGTPARYIHTHVSLIQWRDYCASVRLVSACVRRLDRAAVDALFAFGG